MLSIEKVLKQGRQNSRVQLSDKTLAKVPNSCLQLGFISEDDLHQQKVGDRVDLVHYSLYKEARVRSTPILCRDMSKFDSSKELSLLRALILKNLFVLGRVLSSEELDDLTEDCFLHFWEKNLYQRYNADKLSSYTSYLSRAVRNYLIDLKRSSGYRNSLKTHSLNQRLNKDSDTTLEELLPDNTISEDKLVVDLLSSEYANLVISLRRIVEKLDSEESTGLNFTYLDLFQALFVSQDYSEFVKSSGYSMSTVNIRKNFLVDMLYPAYREAMYA